MKKVHSFHKQECYDGPEKLTWYNLIHTYAAFKCGSTRDLYHFDVVGQSQW